MACFLIKNCWHCHCEEIRKPSDRQNNLFPGNNLRLLPAALRSQLKAIDRTDRVSPIISATRHQSQNPDRKIWSARSSFLNWFWMVTSILGERKFFPQGIRRTGTGGRWKLPSPDLKYTEPNGRFRREKAGGASPRFPGSPYRGIEGYRGSELGSGRS